MFMTPYWLVTAERVMIVLGLLIGLKAIYDLRRYLSVAPDPVKNGKLITAGIYGVIRHPMYVAVWLVMLGVNLNSENWYIIALYPTIVVFFVFKTRYEESKLKTVYEGYLQYTKAVPAYFPKLFAKIHS